MAVLDMVGGVVGIAETVANSVAVCETVLMGMIIADCRSARTPILARNSVWAGSRERGRAMALGPRRTGLHPALTPWVHLTVYPRSAQEIALHPASNRFCGHALSRTHQRRFHHVTQTDGHRGTFHRFCSGLRTGQRTLQGAE